MHKTRLSFISRFEDKDTVIRTGINCSVLFRNATHFHDSKKIFCDFSVRMEPENGKIDNENKENKDIDEFQECILQQKPANTKVKSQSDMKAWNAI